MFNRLNPFGSVSMSERADKIRMLITQIVISLALCVMLYHEVKILTPLYPHNYSTFLGHHLKLDFPTANRDNARIDLTKAWKPRILSNLLGSWITRGSVADIHDGSDHQARFVVRVGLWAALWLGAIFALYLLTFARNALLFIMGTYCGVAFGYMPGISETIYPWDMPALFFFSLFICLLHAGRLIFLLPILPFAVLFKETSALLCLGFLNMDETKKRRLTLFAIAALFVLASKVNVDFRTGSMSRFDFDSIVLRSNFLFFTHNWTPWLLNGGLLLAFLLLPLRHPSAFSIRLIFTLFIAGTLLYGIAAEYRIWFEIIPLGLYALHLHYFPATAPQS
jgi:hypothetical protein